MASSAPLPPLTESSLPRLMASSFTITSQPPAKLDSHHVSFYFEKNRVMFSVPSTTTLAQLKQTFLTALPHLVSNNSAESSALPGLDADDIAALDLPEPISTPVASSSYLSNIKTTSDFVLWNARRGTDMTAGPIEGSDGTEILGWTSLEGDVVDADWSGEDDSSGERGDSLKKIVKEMTGPVWGRWVDVFVSFRQEDGSFSEPTVELPQLDEDDT